jgi:transcription antitermination protein NusB
MSNFKSLKRGDKHSRHSLARLNAVQALYQLENGEQSVVDVIEEFKEHRLGSELDGDQFKDADKPLFEDIVSSSCDRLTEIDETILAALDKGRNLDRLEMIMRALLRAAAYEFIARIDTPAKVLIKEYMDISRAFFVGQEPIFINGVLDKLAKNLRAGEFE